jgi:hypothetical protein
VKIPPSRNDHMKNLEAMKLLCGSQVITSYG